MPRHTAITDILAEKQDFSEYIGQLVMSDGKLVEVWLTAPYWEIAKDNLAILADQLEHCIGSIIFAEE